MTKAFDTLQWQFILKVLNKFGFSHKFCSWISTILKSAFLSIRLNGKLVGFFNFTNGVRQGDPLSPILFYIAEEILSRGITNLVTSRSVKLIKGTRNFSVPSHTLFAYDIIIFSRGDSKSIKAIKDLLARYVACSGQICNLSKSLIYVGSMNHSRHKRMANIIGFKISHPLSLIRGPHI